jgi:hypothetical protein
MNPFFWLLVIAALVLIWFLLSFAYEGIGKFASKLFNDAMDEINKDETKENENNES